MTNGADATTPLNGAQVPESTDERSALDDPLNPTYIGVMILEAIIIAVLWFLGRMYL